MTKLIITLEANDTVDIDALKTDIAKALSVMDGVESLTVLEGALKHFKQGAANA